MENNQLTELINKYIDNEISSEEKTLLENEIRTNPSSQSLLKEMEELKVQIDSEIKLTHEIDFENEIMEKIKQNKNTNKSMFTKINDFLTGFYGSFNVKYAFIFVLGVGLGVLCLTLFNPGNKNVGNENVFGTMSDISTYSNFSRGDNLYIDKQNFNVDINTQYSPRMILAQIDIKSQEQLKITIGYDNKNLLISGLKVVKLNEYNNLMTGYSQVELNNKGEGKYLLFFEKKIDSPQNLSIKIYQNSELVNESSIKTEK